MIVYSCRVFLMLLCMRVDNVLFDGVVLFVCGCVWLLYGCCMIVYDSLVYYVCVCLNYDSL